MHLLRTLAPIAAVTLALISSGCNSSNDCESACKKWGACLGGEAGPPASWTCPLSAACAPAEECHAACIDAASCEALLGTNQAAAASLAQCRATCGGSPPADTGQPDQPVTPHDLGQPDHPQQHDLWPPQPDQHVWPPDQYVWPDVYQPKDQYVWPDTYSGVPFGCETDAECFGLVCCKTPWGVSLCAQQCW